MPQTHIIYHHPCSDGMAAALAAWLKFGDEAVYHGCAYSSPVPDIPKGSRVYLVDFSFKRPVLEELAKRMEYVVVLDHHKTAAEDLAGLKDPADPNEGIGNPVPSNLFARFDMARSGCQIAIDYFQPGVTSHLFDHVGDRDLWKWELGGTAEFAAYLMIQPLTIEAYLRVYIGCSDDQWYKNMLAMGTQLLVAQNQNVERICRSAFQSQLSMPNGAYIRCIMSNTPIYQSEVGDKLLADNPEIPFAAVYYQSSPTHKKVSLRSRVGSDVDVAALAAEFGGGGHKNASGFVTDRF